MATLINCIIVEDEPLAQERIRGYIEKLPFLHLVGIDCQIIIITAHHEHAIRGFELSVTDYLLKPLTFERFLRAVEKAQTNLAKNTPPSNKKFIFVKTEYRLEKILLDEVYYIEGMRDYRKIFTTHKQVMTLQTFRDFEQEIPPEIICRVHKSFMVSLANIDSIGRDTIMIRNTMIPISETYKKSFFQLIVHSTRLSK